MLRLIIGRAGTGKSSFVMSEIKDAVDRRQSGYALIVPEQYSHEAERELCAVCGDALSLYAEVLSFTGFARKMAARFGGGARPWLDKSGRLLCMALAADALNSKLRVFSGANRRAELQTMLLKAVDELKCACIEPAQLMAAASCGGLLGDKLSELALITEAYDAVVANGHADPNDRLLMLAAQIENSDLDENAHFYIDGFTDFTVQETRILEALLRKGASVTVCLGCDDLNGVSEVFSLSRMTARRLLAFAKDNGIAADCVSFDAVRGKAEPLAVFADELFTYSAKRYPGGQDCVSVFEAPDIASECAFAAARAIELTREKNCRWRDIAVAVRGFEDYRLTMEGIFRSFGVPLYSTRRSDVLSKPLPMLISCAYDTVCGGWELTDLFAYLRCGLAGLDAAECDELENYALLWQLHGSAWTDDRDWRLHPDGFGGEFDDKTEKRLERINLLRRTASSPLLHFAQSVREADTASKQAAALAELLEELEVAEKLERRAAQLEENGFGAKAQEYAQLWDITVSALEQCTAILGDTQSDAESFGRLFTLMLSGCDVGSIPAFLDGVTAGDFDRMRRRRIKHLIVLGASDSRLPAASGEGGVFSDEERKMLTELDIDLGGTAEEELWREFSLIYNCLTLPSETLTLCYPAGDISGEAQRPSFAVDRARKLFSLETKSTEAVEYKICSLPSVTQLAAGSLHGGGSAGAAAAEYVSRREPQRLEKLRLASEMSRGRLSPDSVRALYGDRLKLSASRIDRFASCRFSYFMQYGLKAKPREPAGFSPPEMGIFMHYILENTARTVVERGGFAAVSDGELTEICDSFIARYVHDTLNDFREKTPRFEYLFRRLTKSVRRVVSDMAAELRVSDFVPKSFELDFGKAEQLPPLMLGEGEDSLQLTGIADRVDGWLHDGRLYLRVVDYKTGRKSFSMSDVWYGMGLQMLLYLFTLGKNGGRLYGHEIVPAGVLYIPARDVLLSSDTDLTDGEIEEKRLSSIKRSGLLLDDPEVLAAMEHGAEPKYIPVKFKDGCYSGEALASAEKLGLLSRHIDDTLRGMAAELHRGSIAADPYYRTQQENACLNCDYFAACRFVNGENGESIRSMPKLPATKVWTMLEGGKDDA